MSTRVRLGVWLLALVLVIVAVTLFSKEPLPETANARSPTRSSRSSTDSDSNSNVSLHFGGAENANVTPDHSQPLTPRSIAQPTRDFPDESDLNSSAPSQDNDEGRTKSRARSETMDINKSENTSMETESLHASTEFHFCRATSPTLGDTTEETAHVELWYQCRGKEYKKLTRKLHAFVQNTTAYGISRPSSWGRRQHALPAHAKVLMFGNSHTRQVGLALACQYRHQLTEVHRFDTNMLDPNMAQRFTFSNGAQLYLVSNSYVAYSPRWQSLLERQIGVALNDMDAVIVGLFNASEGADCLERKSMFMQTMVEMQADLPLAYQVDILRFPAPQFITVAQAYSATGDNESFRGGHRHLLQHHVGFDLRRPIAFVSMFAAGQTDRTKRNVAQVRKMALKGFDNAASINSGTLLVTNIKARAYLEKIDLEGAAIWKADSHQHCHNGRDYSRRHRCFGKEGGHADLIAWDVIEFVHDAVVQGSVTDYLQLK